MVLKSYYTDIEEEQRQREEERREASKRNNNATNWTKGITGLLSGNEAITRSAFSGSTDNFLKQSSKMSTAEMIGTIASLVIMSVAGEGATRAGRRSGLTRDISTQSIREQARAQGVVLAEDLEAQLDEFTTQWNSRTPTQRAQNIADFNRAIREDAQADLDTATTTADAQQAQTRIDEANNMFSRYQQEARDLNAELNRAIETRAPNTADIVIPEPQPNTAISRLVDELDDSVINEVFDERVALLENYENYNAEMSAVHPEVQTYTYSENTLQFREQQGRYHNTANELIRFMKSRDGKKLLAIAPAVLATTAEAIDANKDPTESALERRRMVDPELLEEKSEDAEIVINPDGTQEVLPKKPTDPVDGGGTDATSGTDAERSVRPADEEKGKDTADMKREESAGTTTSKESTEAFNTKRTIIEHNTDELLQNSLLWSQRAYNDEAQYQRNVYRIDSPDFPVLVHKDRRRLYIAFRGTDPMKMINIITDLNTVFGNTSTSGYDQFAGKLYTDAQKVKFHSGFLKALSRVYQQIIQQIEYYGRESLDEIIVTGHSAGGALASIFTFIYNSDATIIDIRERLPIYKCITFASPRCLINTDDAHDTYTKYCPNVTRVWLTEDLITYLPLHDKLAYADPEQDTDEQDSIYGFIHVGTSFCLDGNRVRNNLNVYMTNEVQKSRDVVNDLLGMSDTQQVKELLQLTTSPEFMTYLFNGAIECAKATQCKELSEFDIRAMAKNVQTNTKQLTTYAQKCGVLEPLNLADYLRTLPLGEDDSVDKQDYSLAYVGYYAVKQNIKLFTHHDLDTYEERLGFLISRQVSTNENITDPIRQENTERGETVNELREDATESITQPYVLGIYEGNYTSGDMIEF